MNYRTCSFYSLISFGLLIFQLNAMEDGTLLQIGQMQQLCKDEECRQQSTLSLVASENHAPGVVLELLSSRVGDKTAEGTPGKRYYEDCQIVDEIESKAQTWCKELFGTDHANVQPHSGSQANISVYKAVLEPGDTIMGLNLSGGGHLTHGYKGNLSGQMYKVIPYNVDPQSEQFDYDTIERLALMHNPKLIVAGASAYSRTIDFAKFADIAKKSNALLLVDIAHIAGLIAAKLHPSPVPHADFITGTTFKTLRGPHGGFILCKKEYAQAIDKAVMPGTQGSASFNKIAAQGICFKLAQTERFKQYQHQVIRNAQAMAQRFKELGYRIVADGTDTHLFIVDLQSQGITGKQAANELAQSGITVTKSTIPYDTKSPLIGSGIRIGTAAITTRGLDKQDSIRLVDLIDTVIHNHDKADSIKTVREIIQTICLKHPIPVA